MVIRSTVGLLCLLVAVGATSGHREPAVITGFLPEDTVNELSTDESEWSMESLQNVDVAGDRLVVDRTAVAARSPAGATMLEEQQLDQLQARIMMDLLEKIHARQVAETPVPLLPAAHMNGEPNLKAECHEQMAEPLSVETAVAAATRAIKHSCVDLRQAAVDFIKDNLFQVLATDGWAHAVRTQPEEVVQLSRLLAAHFAATSSSGTTQPTTTTTSTTTTTTTTTTIQPDGDVSRHGQNANDVVTCPNTPLDEDKVSAYRILPEEVKSQRLIEAAQEGQVEELRTLLAAGALPNSRDVDGTTVLQWAAWRAQPEVARCLLDAGSAVDATDNEGYQPLHMATIGGHSNLVKLLVAWGADPNARDILGRTPLHFAVRRDNQEAALALLEAGARDEVDNYDGLTQRYRETRPHSVTRDVTTRRQTWPGGWLFFAPRI